MIVNRTGLLRAAPIKNMLTEKVQASPTSYGLTECGYDIRIAESIHFTGKWDRNNHPMIQTIFPDGTIKNSTGVLALGSSVEEFNMPTNLMGRVLNKSTWARQGLDASMTTNVEPAWNGYLTIELIYHGMDDLFIPAGSGICQIIFESIEEDAEYTGKYQNQKAGPQEAITLPNLADRCCGTIKNAVFLNGQYHGEIYGDTKKRFDDGTVIHTSRVLSEQDGYAVTRNSVYKIERFNP